MLNKYSLKPGFLSLAPMDDVTDRVFRKIINGCFPPDLSFTEFVNVDGLVSKGREVLRKKLDHPKDEKNLIAQIWGLNPSNFYTRARDIAAKEFQEFIGVDLNMGCPDKTVVKNGACSALINNQELAFKIINATKKGLKNKLPLSVKTRLGFNKIDYSWHEFLLKQNLDMLIIHGRTRSEMSKVPADWKAIAEIRKLRDKISPGTLIVGNGDVLSFNQAKEYIKKYKLDGIMIGRGVFQDPFIFSNKSPWNQMSRLDKFKLFKKHVELYKSTWQDAKPIQVLNKFCKIYINNFEGSKEIREDLMSSKSSDELLSKINKQIELVGAVGIEPTTKRL